MKNRASPVLLLFAAHLLAPQVAAACTSATYERLVVARMQAAEDVRLCEERAAACSSATCGASALKACIEAAYRAGATGE